MAIPSLPVGKKSNLSCTLRCFHDSWKCNFCICESQLAAQSDFKIYRFVLATERMIHYSIHFGSISCVPSYDAGVKSLRRLKEVILSSIVGRTLTLVPRAALLDHCREHYRDFSWIVFGPKLTTVVELLTL